jgi:diketogulonate reductase-like aldo/keto reductase
MHAPFLLGLIAGGAVIYWFTGASAQAVTTGAYRAVEFIKRNIKLESSEKASVADSKKVVEICTKYAQKGMLNIFLVVFFATLAFAFLEPFFFVGYLISIALFGLYQAIFMANAGGAWDNAKKVVETELRAKGTPLHDACVVGDTVGDPFKDTSSVALNPIIKFTTLFGLLAVSLAVDLSAKQGNAVHHLAGGVYRVLRHLRGLRLPQLLRHAHREHTGARMPAIGLGTFGSDHVTAEEIAAAVKGAAAVGYRHFDCASVYRNEDRIGLRPARDRGGGIPREELWITSKLWNDKHAEADVIPSCRQSLADLQLDYLDMYLVHWPFPNFHPPGCDVSSRSPDARPYIHENYMKTWRQMEKLVDLGLVRHIGTSNMTIPKLKLLLPDARIKPAVNEMEMHPHLQQTELFEFVRAQGHRAHRLQPIGSPGRPERDRTPDRHGGRRRPGDRRHRPAARRASGGGLREVGRAARRHADPVLRQPAQLPGEPAGRGEPAADRCRHGGHRGHR